VDVAHQDQLATAILSLFATVIVVGGALFFWWLGRKITAAAPARWPRAQARAVFNLFAVGIVGGMVGATLQPIVSGFAPQLSHNPAMASWLQRGSLVCFQIGLLLVSTSLSWLVFLLLRYPLEPSTPGGMDYVKPRDIVGESLLIAITVGYAANSLVYWIGSFALAAGVGFAAFLLAFLIAFFVLSRILRPRRTRG
jgi:hypothetical protein